MEGIITKLLGNYLKKFIKGFNKEMLSLQIMKGQATMKDFELNGEILQELMMVPPNLEVVSAKCTQLDMAIPYMNLKHEPITITLDRIDISLVEPEVIKPMPNTLQLMNKRNLTEKAEKMSVIKGVKLVVKTCHVTVQTLGRNTFHPDWKPSLVLEVSGLVIQSVNDKWEVVDLEKTFILDRENSIEKTYKQAKIESISIYNKMLASENPSPILENIPAELRFVTHADSRTGLWLASSLEVLFEELNFSWTQGNWQRMADLGLSIQACFAREVPERQGLDSQALIEARNEKMNKVSYGMNINRFVIELLKGQQGGEDGFTCFGFGLQMTLSPPRLTEYVVRDLGGRGADQKVECWESILETSIASITLRERKPSPDKEPPYNRLLTQVLDTKKGDTFKPTNSALLALTVTHRSKIACDEMLKRRVPTLEFSASMNGMQIVFDKQAWKDLASFIMEGPVEAGIEQQSQKLLAQAQDKKIEDLRDYYHINAKFDFLAAETMLIIPPVVESESVTKAADLRNHALHMHMSKMTVTNQPDWPFPPFLKDALVHLPQRNHSLTPAEGTIHKFQGELHNISFQCVELGEKGEKKETLLQPTTVRFYGRYFPPHTEKDSLHRVEAMLHSSEMYGRVTSEMARYFHHLEEEHRKWGIITTREELERRRVNKMMQAAASGVSEMKSSDMGDKKGLITLNREALDKAEEYAITTAKYLLENLHTTAFLKLEKGCFEVPSPGALDSLIRQFELEEADGEKEKEEKQKLTRPDVKDWESKLSSFAFEKFETVLDNNITSQTVALKLRSIEATGVDHPHMLASASVRCLPGRTGPTNCMELHVSRDCNIKPPHTTANFRVQGIQVASVGKPGGMQKGLLELLPEMKNLLSTAVSKYKQTSSEMKDEVLGYLKESAFRAHEAASRVIEGGLEGLVSNVTWKVEVGETEYQYLPPETEGAERKPIGLLLLASSNKDSLESQFKDVEEQLINAKLALAQSESEKYDMQNQSHLAGEQVKKVKEEMKVLEGQLVQTKFVLAEAQMENDNLKSELKRLQDELASRPAGGAAEKKTGGGVGGLFGRKK